MIAMRRPQFVRARVYGDLGDKSSLLPLEMLQVLALNQELEKAKAFGQTLSSKVSGLPESLQSTPDPKPSVFPHIRRRAGSVGEVKLQKGPTIL